MSSSIPQTGTLYSARQSQLKAIADKIRANAGVDALAGKNILPTGSTIAKAEAGKTYIASASVTWDGTAIYALTLSFLDAYGNVLIDYSTEALSVPDSGTTSRESESGVAPQDTVFVSVTVTSGLTATNVMIEEAESGQTGSSEYEAYAKRDIVFPDEFVSCIDKLVSTTDADALAKHIKSGKTAYARGQKITGTGLVVKENTYSSTFPTGSSAQTIAAGSMYRLLQYPMPAGYKGIKRISSSGYSVSDFDVVYYQSFHQNGGGTVSVFMYNKSGASKTVQAKSVTLTFEYYTEEV